jgi:hypothetical protein
MLVGDYYDKVNSYTQLFGKTNNDEHMRELSNAVFSRQDDSYKKRLDEIIIRIETEVKKHIKK